MTIQNFYSDVLSALNYRLMDDGLISIMDPEGGVSPATVSGMRLVMPTKERLREGFNDDEGKQVLQPFHPLAESISRKGTSPVLQHMQRTAKALMAYYFIEVSRRLLEVAADQSLHKDLPPACSEYLKKVSKADKKCLDVFDDLIEKALLKNSLITVYLKNGGKKEGVTYNRLCVIHFPIMDVIDGTDDAPFGVKLRKKDKETISAIFHHVLPFGADPENYSAGSNSRTAPYFDCFMKSYSQIATQFNKIVKRYKPIDLPLKEINLAFTSKLDDIASFHNELPSLRGNEGAPDKDEPAEAAKPVTRPTAQTNPHQVTAAQQPNVSAGTNPAGLSVKDFLSSMRPQQPQQVYQQPQQQPMYGGGGYNQYGQPMQDPRQPSWLVGNTQQPQQPQNPFAQAVMQPQQPQQPMYNQNPYGGMAGQPQQGYVQPQQMSGYSPTSVL